MTSTTTRCTKCNAYNPSGLGLKKCIECDEPLTELAEKKITDESIASPQKESSPTPPPTPPASGKFEDHAEPPFEKLKKLTIVFFILQLIILAIRSTTAMRMDPFAGNLVYGLPLIFLNLSSLIVFLYLLVTMRAVTDFLHKNRIIAYPALAFVIAEIILALVNSLILGMLIPFWLLLVKSKYYKPTLETTDLKGASLPCPQCGTSNKGGYAKCWKCGALEKNVNNVPANNQHSSDAPWIPIIIFLLFSYLYLNDLFSSSSVLLLPEYQHQIKEQWYQVSLIFYLVTLFSLIPFLSFYLIKKYRAKSIWTVALILIISIFKFYGPTFALWVHHLKGRI